MERIPIFSQELSIRRRKNTCLSAGLLINVIPRYGLHAKIFSSRRSPAEIPKGIPFRFARLVFAGDRSDRPNHEAKAQVCFSPGLIAFFFPLAATH
jgi:hypothetical protein